MNVLITGANGFLGSWLCTAALESPEVKVIAAVRASADLSKLPESSRLTVEQIDYSSETSLIDFFQRVESKNGSIDLLIHNAGLTKSTRRADNFTINKGLTKMLIKAISISNILSKTGIFTYISSQAALGPRGAGGPVSAYGESKLAAESVIKGSGLPYNIFRPTGIYGPGDSEFLKLFKAVKMGVYPCAAPITQKLTLIHAYDVAKNVIELSTQFKNKTIHLSDNNVYLHHDVKKAIESTLLKKSMMLKIPIGVVRAYLGVAEWTGKLLGFSPILTVEKHNEISKDWDHDFSLERKEIPLSIKFQLQSGFANTASHYIAYKLL